MIPISRMPARAWRTAAALGLLVACLAPTPAAAQRGPTMERVEVALWPEYDRPAVLVIYRLDLAPATTLPATLGVVVPAAAGEPHAVAEMSAGKLVTLPYRRTVDGALARIEVTANQPQVQIEYYDPGLSREGTRRQFTFAWNADYPVDDLSIAVQEPPQITGFALDPESTETTRGSGGLLYAWVRLGAVGADQSRTVSFGYDKAADELTADQLPPPAAPAQQPATNAGTTSGSSSRAWVWSAAIGLLALALGLVLAGVGIMRRSRRDAEIGPGDGTFCTGCGAAITQQARFCGQCGRQLD